MKLYTILSNARSDIHASELSIKKACLKKGIAYERINADETSLQSVIDGLPAAYDGLLYRIGTSAKAAELEAFLAEHHPNVTTIYHPVNITHPRKRFWEMSAQISNGLRVIPTLIVDTTWVNTPDEALVERLEAIGSFPIILKVLGKSHGQGVMKIESLNELHSALTDIDQESICIARKYLSDYRHYRLIVVADKVVAAIEYHKPVDDFRTNAAKKPEVSAVALEELSDDMKALAISATRLRSSLVSGVDILVDSTTDIPYLAEVNVPCNFSRAELPTGIDIGLLIVEALLEKRRNEGASDV